MDLDLAIWQINPAAEYRLTDDKAALLEWRGPGKEPTADELTAAWTQYQAEHPQPDSDAAAKQRAADLATILDAMPTPESRAALARFLGAPES